MGKALDLTNQRFGRLVALYKTDKKSNRCFIWHCKCDCGNECDIVGRDLKSGHTKSCGCLKKENFISYNKEIYQDITGKKFGKLIVLYDTKKIGKFGRLWHCRCDCGTEVDISGTHLKNGNTKSCGCIKSIGESIIGQILSENKIFFQKEKTFQNCKFPNTNSLAKFDFYVNNQYLIEYDGIQHFSDTHGWNNKENFEKIKQRDEYKNQWCKDNNIPLIRIPYWHLDNLCIEDLLLEISQYLIK